jgi:predicted AAA+ superfamily ATPase
MEGHAFETLLFQELRAINDILHAGYTLHYWRTASNYEVDFVLYGAKGLLAFEVKRTGKVTDAMLAGLKSFMKDYPMAKPFLVYGGTRRMTQAGIDIVPMETLLHELPAVLS